MIHPLWSSGVRGPDEHPGWHVPVYRQSGGDPGTRSHLDAGHQVDVYPCLDIVTNYGAKFSLSRVDPTVFDIDIDVLLVESDVCSHRACSKITVLAYYAVPDIGEVCDMCSFHDYAVLYLAGVPYPHIGTEIGILHRLRKENPGKVFHEVSPLADCPNMKLNTIEKMVWALEDMVHEVTIDPDVAQQAKRSIDRIYQLR